MKKSRIIIKLSLILAAIMILFTACGAKVDSSQIVGDWSRDPVLDVVSEFTFKADGTFTRSSTTAGDFSFTTESEGTWTLENNVIILKEDFLGTEDVSEFEVSIDGDTMTWTRDKAVHTLHRK